MFFIQLLCDKCPITFMKLLQEVVIVFMYSMDAYKALQEKDAKLLHLQKRRKRLAALLAEEREQLHVS